MIVAVELDPEMAKLTQEAVAGFPSVRVLNTDALANKNTLSPIMIESVEEAGLVLRPESSSWWLTCPTTWRRRSS